VIVGLTGTVLIWAERCRFGTPGRESRRLSFGQKLMFWLGAAAGLATVTPMLAAMLPVFGYAAQDTLKDIHGTSATVLVVVMLVHTVVSLRARGAKR
jgi:cytochrome b subunit of formate dehydrogenase